MTKARKIKAKKNISSSRGFSLSRKVGEMIPWESTIERDFIRLLEFDNNVEYFESQPLVIKYALNGKEKKYYPDFKVITKDDFVRIYEVKPYNMIKKEENIIKFKVGEKYCEEKGWKYHVVTEKDIRKGFLQENLNDLFDVLDQPRNSNIERKIMESLVNNECSIKELGSIHVDIAEELIYVYVYVLILYHYIETDLINSKLNSYSILKIKTT